MSDLAPQLSSSFIQIKGLRLHYFISEPHTSTQTQPLKTIVFLHGFPEHCGVWQKQLAYFGNHYRAIALDLPGYNLSEAPKTLKQYAVPNLVSILAEFLTNIAPNAPVLLVAHDWGGALAWPLANRYPELIERLVILNAAHPSTFTREMINNQNQRVMSDYIHDFLDPNAQNDLAENNFSALKAHSIDKMQVALSTKEIEEYEIAWSKPYAIDNMLNYYRAMPQLFPRETSLGHTAKSLDKNTQSPEKPLNAIKIPQITIKMPTLVLWGENDQAFDIAVLDKLEDYIEDYQEQRFADASHWLHHEKPDEVNAAIERFFRKGKGSV